MDRLRIPVERAYWDQTPKVEGWRPYWVNINLDRSPQKIVTYLRETDPYWNRKEAKHGA